MSNDSHWESRKILHPTKKREGDLFLADPFERVELRADTIRYAWSAAKRRRAARETSLTRAYYGEKGEHSIQKADIRYVGFSEEAAQKVDASLAKVREDEARLQAELDKTHRHLALELDQALARHDRLVANIFESEPDCRYRYSPFGPKRKPLDRVAEESGWRDLPQDDSLETLRRLVDLIDRRRCLPVCQALVENRVGDHGERQAIKEIREQTWTWEAIEFLMELGVLRRHGGRMHGWPEGDVLVLTSLAKPFRTLIEALQSPIDYPAMWHDMSHDDKAKVTNAKDAERKQAIKAFRAAHQKFTEHWIKAKKAKSTTARRQMEKVVVSEIPIPFRKLEMAM